MFVGYDAGAFVPKKIAASRARPTASVSSGIASSHTFASMSAITLSGTGMIVAISSMLRNLLDQLTSVVCFIPVSPVTKYAVGSADRTGNRTCARPTGTFRNRASAADCSVAFPSIARDTSSGISAPTSVRLVRLLNGTGAS